MAKRLHGFTYYVGPERQIEAILSTTARGLKRQGQVNTIAAQGVLNGNEWAIGMYLDYIAHKAAPEVHPAPKP